jgi:hypothetical protein
MRDLAIEPFYSFTSSNYQAAQLTPQFLDRDSDLHVGGVKAVYFLPEIATSFDAGIALLYNHAVGSDFDYRAIQYSAGFTSNLPYDFVLQLSGVWTRYTYSNFNSLAINNATGLPFNLERRDNTAAFSTRLSREIWGPVDGFLQYDFANDRSNVPSYGYSQNQIRFGVLARY